MVREPEASPYPAQKGPEDIRWSSSGSNESTEAPLRIDAELAFHLEMRTRENLAAGAAPDEARRRAMERLATCAGRVVRSAAVPVLPARSTFAWSRQRTAKLRGLFGLVVEPEAGNDGRGGAPRQLPDSGALSPVAAWSTNVDSEPRIPRVSREALLLFPLEILGSRRLGAPAG